MADEKWADGGIIPNDGKLAIVHNDYVLPRAMVEKLEDQIRERTLNTISEEATGCCARLGKALRDKPDLAEWTCPKCGLLWKPRDVGGVRHWEAHPDFVVWKR